MSETQFPIGQRINLPGHFPEPVVLEAVRSIGEGFECPVRLADGTPDEAILSREEADTLLGHRADTPTSVAPVDAEKFRLLIESARIRLAYAYDKHFAVSLSGIRTLPHQIGYGSGRPRSTVAPALGISGGRFGCRIRNRAWLGV